MEYKHITKLNQRDATIRNLVNSLVLGMIVALFITRLVVPTVVSGNSMYPTLENKNLILVNVLNTTPKKSDIIVFEPNRIEGILIKRVIATEGDHLEVKSGEVYINKEKVHEEYIEGEWVFGDYEGVIPSGYMYVMGDNRNYSYDSRDMGLVDTNSIKGKLLFKIK